jgi:DNA-binding transcriptional LysR family regulator
VPEIRQLRYFIAVAEELNFTRAAERLHMAQPPLSAAIRRLEQEIGFSLFARSSREVRLTEAGTALLEGARRTLAQADAALTAARRVATGEHGRLRLGYNWSSRFDTLPRLGRALDRAHPEIELMAEEMHPSQMAPALTAGTIDGALALCPDVLPGLAYRLVRRESVVALLSDGRRLAHEQAIDLGLLADEFRLFPRKLAPRLHDFYANLCRVAGFEPEQSTESVPTRWTIGTWERSSVTLLPESVCRDLPDGVVAVRIAFPPERLEAQLFWRSDDRNPNLAAFVEVSSRVFPERDGPGHGLALASSSLS